MPHPATAGIGPIMVNAPAVAEMSAGGVCLRLRHQVRYAMTRHGGAHPLDQDQSTERQRRCFSRLPQFFMLHHCLR